MNKKPNPIHTLPEIDDVKQRDAGALRPDNRRWNYKQTFLNITMKK
jgi:hypothetical protein